MAIALPRGLPARGVLRREGIGLIDDTKAGPPCAPPLRIALLNLMPDKVTTETQFARMLGSAPHDVDLTLVVPDTHTSRTTPESHRSKFYRGWSQVRDVRFDGLIITGAPVETLPFETVRYWPEFTEILDWTQSHVGQTLHICWAAQAALQHFHGVPKHDLPEKLSGVFPHRIVRHDSALLRGFSDFFPVPVSRKSEVRGADLPEGRGLDVLAEAAGNGLCLIGDASRRALYMFNHLEYDARTLGDEFDRDLAAGQPAKLPKNYYPDDDRDQPPCAAWRPYGHLFFRNWLDLMDQETKRSTARDAASPGMLPGPFPRWQNGVAHSKFLLVADPSPDAVPNVLSRLAVLGLSPRALKAQPRDRGIMVIDMCLDSVGETKGQAVARELLKLGEIRRVSYRDTKGSGGTFIRDFTAPTNAADAAPRAGPLLGIGRKAADRGHASRC